MPPAAPPRPPGAFAYTPVAVAWPRILPAHPMLPKAPAADYSRVYKYITDPSPENAKAADVREF